MKKGSFPDRVLGTDLFSFDEYRTLSFIRDSYRKRKCHQHFRQGWIRPGKSHVVRAAAADFPPEENEDDFSVRFVINQN